MENKASPPNMEFAQVKAFDALADALFGADPYCDFKPTIAARDDHGWNGTHPALTRLVNELAPSVIVDVGVWKGQSTITLADAQANSAPDGIVIAVDTFLGSPEHWKRSRTDIHAALQFRNGRPTFYDVFLSNVVFSGHRKRIFPLNQTSENAVLILRENGTRPDFVHIDAAHQYGAVKQDIDVWFGLLKPAGLLMGDDYQHPDVARAVNDFCETTGNTFDIDPPKWWIRKAP